MMTMFAICAAMGVVAVIFENGAKAASIAPSMYRTSGAGWLLVIIGVVGFLCARYLP